MRERIKLPPIQGWEQTPSEVSMATGEACCPLQELESVEDSGKLNDNVTLTIFDLSSYLYNQFYFLES